MGALRNYGRTLRQSETPQPSLADLARKAGKGVEQTKAPVAVEQTEKKGNVGPPPVRRHPRDRNLVYDEKSKTWQPAHKVVTMSGRAPKK